MGKHWEKKRGDKELEITKNREERENQKEKIECRTTDMHQ